MRFHDIGFFMDDPDNESIKISYLEECNSYILLIKQNGENFGHITLHFQTKELLKSFIKKIKKEIES